MPTCYDEGVETFEFEAQGFVEIVMVDGLFEAVYVFLPVDVKALLVLLIRYAVVFFAAEHYGGALHIIIDNIFQNGYHSLVLKRVEEDFLLSRHLDLFVAHFEV